MKLSINIDHIATLRQARKGLEPDPVLGARQAILAQADGITFHLREDRRHIQEEDVYRMKKEIQAPLNFEGAVTDRIIDIILDVVPHEATFVPEKREEVTTEGGLNVVESREKIKRMIPKLKSKKILVSLFVDPDPEQIDAAREVDADAIEIHTGKYANLKDPKRKEKELKLIREMAEYADSLGLIVNAGHGLNYENTKAIRDIKIIQELNIGHSIISKSIFTGIYQAVTDMVKIIKG